jgi:hypothetical protein
MCRALVVPASAACLALAASLSAQQVTRSFDYKPVGGIQNIQLVVEDVRVNQVVFKVPKEGGASSRASKSEAVVRVDNESGAPVAVGVAVVVMDESGNILAAGSGGTRAGWLAAGERFPVTMRFPYVSRNFSKAKRFTITMEIEPKPDAGEAAPPAGGTPSGSS